jgi:dihydroxy-acid dehydratase
MEAGKVCCTARRALDLVDAMVAAADDKISDEDVSDHRTLGLPDLRFLLRHVHRQLDELPDRSPRPVAARQRLDAGHPRRPQALFLEAGRVIVDLCQRYYEQDDATALPRTIAKGAFENAMTLDIAMGGSTNTVLHILAAAHEGEIDFTMEDIDRLSRRVPCLSKVAPAKADVHMEDVHRAGGIMAILGELNRGGLLNADLPTVHATTWAKRWPMGYRPHQQRSRPRALQRRARRHADPGRLQPGARWEELDLDRENGVIRSVEHPFSKDGGLAVLFGNLALDGCIVKTAGVDESILKFSGPARVFESQDAPSRRSLPTRSRPATSSSSATKARRAARACRKCSIRPAI